MRRRNSLPSREKGGVNENKSDLTCTTASEGKIPATKGIGKGLREKKEAIVTVGKSEDEQGSCSSMERGEQEGGSKKEKEARTRNYAHPEIALIKI